MQSATSDALAGIKKSRTIILLHEQDSFGGECSFSLLVYGVYVSMVTCIS